MYKQQFKILITLIVTIAVLMAFIVKYSYPTWFERTPEATQVWKITIDSETTYCFIHNVKNGKVFYEYLDNIYDDPGDIYATIIWSDKIDKFLRSYNYEKQWSDDYLKQENRK